MCVVSEGVVWLAGVSEHTVWSENSNHVVRDGQLNHGVVSEPNCVVDKHVVHPVNRYMYHLVVFLGPPPPPPFPTHSFLSHRQPMRQYATPVMSFPVHSSGHNGG